MPFPADDCFLHKIIYWVHEQKGHSLTLSDFASVFRSNADRYPREKYDFLFDLMKLYELAYETGIGKRLIIPHLLHEDRPATLPDFPVGESLMLKYKAEQPWPSNTISRFIVRHHQEIKKEGSDYAVWRYGVALEDGQGSLALVREDEMTRTISVEVKGADKTNYISALRATLDDIFSSYKSKKPDLLYRVERFGLLPPEDIRSREPLMLSEQKIINHVQQNELYYDDETRQKIPMSDVATTYNININIKAEAVVFIDNRITVNFYNCNIHLQGHLNDLAQLLKEAKHPAEASELEGVAKALEQVEDCKTPAELTKKGVMSRLKRLVEQLGDENSGLHKTVKTIKNGASLVREIIQAYKTISGWRG